MAERDTILVTGATGQVGRSLVQQLRQAGASVRALVREPGSAHLPDGVTAVRGDLSRPDTLPAAALDGVAAVFLLWPFPSAEGAPEVLDFLASGPDRIVFLSSMGAEPDQAGTPFHREIESLIRPSGLDWVFLRAGGFGGNTLIWAPQIRSGRASVRWPYARAARSLIHERDIAAVAAQALAGNVTAPATLVLTGPAAVTQEEQVHLIGEAIGRPLRYEEISPEAALEQMLADGWPREFAEHALGYWATLVQHPEPVTHTVADVTGTEARPFRQWALDHAGDFR
jgi:uncharacterized protein YbjT (DUF2867 family)